MQNIQENVELLNQRYGPFYERRTDRARVHKCDYFSNERSPYWSSQTKYNFANVDLFFNEAQNNSEEIDEICARSILPYMRDTVPNLDLIRGDLIVVIGLSGYRNRFVYIYNDSRLISLVYESNDNIDDEGHLPMSFKAITEFPPKYFEMIAHNRIIWVTKEISDLIKKEARKKGNVKLSQEIPYLTFKYNDKLYKLKLNEDEESDDPIETFKELIRDLDQGVYLNWDYEEENTMTIHKFEEEEGDEEDSNDEEDNEN